MRALRSGEAKRPSLAMQRGTISMRDFGAASATERAERIETSCSALRPPKMRRVRMGMARSVKQVDQRSGIRDKRSEFGSDRSTVNPDLILVSDLGSCRQETTGKRSISR